MFRLLQGLLRKSMNAKPIAVTHKAAETAEKDSEGADEGLLDHSEEQQEHQAEEDENEKNTEEEEENEKEAVDEDDEEELIKKDEILDESF